MIKSAEEFVNSGEVANTYCLITDQQLPGLSGTDLQAYLRAAGYWTPVIFITAYDVPTVRERALAAGAIAYLTKPFDDAVLLPTFRRFEQGQGFLIRIALGPIDQHADAPHPLGLLCEHGDRPGGCRAAEEGEEVASMAPGRRD
jgi:CheY-like chemotaxis protein